MVKKTAFILVVGMMMITLHPATGLCWHSHHHGYYGDDAWLWGLGGILLGTAITAAIVQPPPPPEVVYMPPPRQAVYMQPRTPVYTYPPDVPPGLCRWERFMLDSYGRTITDQYGQPVKEYTIGSCQYPPN